MLNQLVEGEDDALLIRVKVVKHFPDVYVIDNAEGMELGVVQQIEGNHKCFYPVEGVGLAADEMQQIAEFLRTVVDPRSKDEGRNDPGDQVYGE